MVFRSTSKQEQYYVLVSEWGMRTLVIVRANSATDAEAIARQNAGKEFGWEGIHNVYHAFPVTQG